MSESLRNRALLVSMLFACGFTVVSCRLVWLQLVQHEKYREEAVRQHYVGIPIPPNRGSILDRRGHVLAQTVTVTDLRIDGKLAWETPEIFDQLAPILGSSPPELKERVDARNRYRLLAAAVDEQTLARLRALQARSLRFEERMVRAYPNGPEASHVIGFVNRVSQPSSVEGKTIEMEVGIDGVERTMDRFLKGIPGERRVVRDGTRLKREIPAYRQSDRPARDGQNVVLTLDLTIQHIIEQELDRIVVEHQPEAAHIVVLNPNTGEILALANRPSFDPNDRSTMNARSLRNAALQNTYEPGSTFKVVTLAAALNEGVADLDTPIFCENGEFFYAGKYLRDHQPYGTLRLGEVMAKSSNIGFAKIALILGPEKVRQYATVFGFGAKTQGAMASLMAEEQGVLHPLKKWSGLSITRVPMGYEVAVTNLQMAMAYAAVANGGRLMEPRLVSAVVDRRGQLVAQYLPRAVRQVVRPQVAAELKRALNGVVSDTGTAQKASVRGFDVAGKTGTAQKLKNGAYDRQHYIASFIGFLPADRPEFLVSIVVDEPKGKQIYGGQVAAPAFSNIASQVAAHLNLVSAPQSTLVKGGLR